VKCIVLYKEKPQYNNKRRTITSRVFKATSLLSPLGNLQDMRRLSTSSPHLLTLHDAADTVSNASGQSGSPGLVNIHSPSYDSDTPHVDSVSYGNLQYTLIEISSSSSLIVSRTRLLTVGDRAFPVTAARLWNSLPDLVTFAPSVAVFWSRLKTHLCNISYPCDCTVPVQ